jgi:hypothetical protein
LATWESAGYKVSSQVVNGPPFWQTIDIDEAPKLITATLRALAEP